MNTDSRPRPDRKSRPLARRGSGSGALGPDVAAEGADGARAPSQPARDASDTHPPSAAKRATTSEFRFRIFKDPASSWSHFIGFWLALAAAAALVWRVADDGPKATGMAIYGGTLVTLFLASSLYHWFDIGEAGNRWLRRLDHSAIFLLIAGTYVPLLLHLLDGTWRIAILSLVVGVAAAGALLKVIWIDCPEWLSLALYFGLSAVIVVPAHKILPQLSGGALAWLVGGGLAYTLGAVVYARAWPDPWPGRFGHHEIWHLFVLAGAGAHYAFAYSLVDLPYAPF